MMGGNTVEEDIFGRIKTINLHGKPEIEVVRRFTLTNVNNVSVQVINYGATIQSINVPDRDGNFKDIVLGFDTFEEYVSHPFYFGGTIGRVANRIANGTFKIKNKVYTLTCNKGNNHLHGGKKGFDKALWDSHVEGNAVTFSYLSTSWEEGYPGEVTARVTYELTPENELLVQHHATTTQTTPINLTNHSYFNLGGHESGPIYSHEITISADHYTPVNNTIIPTGEIAPVDGTVFDLRRRVPLMPAMSQVPGGGFDHNFCINGETGTHRHVASVWHPESGRRMDVSSSQPGVQFYTSNFLPEEENKLIGKGSATYVRHSAFCLETQNYPDSVNQSKFPNCLVMPGEVYNHTTTFHFSTC